MRGVENGSRSLENDIRLSTQHEEFGCTLGQLKPFRSESICDHPSGDGSNMPGDGGDIVVNLDSTSNSIFDNTFDGSLSDLTSLCRDASCPLSNV